MKLHRYVFNRVKYVNSLRNTIYELKFYPNLIISVTNVNKPKQLKNCQSLLHEGLVYQDHSLKNLGLKRPMFFNFFLIGLIFILNIYRVTIMMSLFWIFLCLYQAYSQYILYHKIAYRFHHPTFKFNQQSS